MRDTSPEVEEMQVSIHRRMTGEQRLRLALDMSQLLHEMALSRIRSEHPDWPERECVKELLRIKFGSRPLPPPLR